MVKLPEYYPAADRLLEPENGLVRPFSPVGVTIHYTATGSVESAHNGLKSQGLNYHLIIGRDGEIVQTAKLTHSVYHAGRAEWLGVSPNRGHIAIALVSWGHVDADNKSWAGVEVPNKQVRVKDGMRWHIATSKQEAQLILTCRWLVCQGIRPSRICGHDECCIPAGRKLDPGGILSKPMDSLRRLLHSALV